MKHNCIFNLIKGKLDGRESEDELIAISIDETREQLFKFVIWCDENCCYINPETSLWESQLLNIKDYNLENLFFIFEYKVF